MRPGSVNAASFGIAQDTISGVNGAKRLIAMAVRAGKGRTVPDSVT
jgi:hypothetical protein